MAFDQIAGQETISESGADKREVVLRDLPGFMASSALTKDEKRVALDAEIRRVRRIGDRGGRVAGDAAARLIALIRAEAALTR